MPSPFPVRYDLLAAAVFAAVAVTVWQMDPAMADEQDTVRVAIASDVQAFSNEYNSSESIRRLRRAMRRGAVEQWEQFDDIEVQIIDDDALHEQVVDNSLYDGTLQLAREWGEMGIEAYKQLQTREAADYLERSLSNFRDISHDFVDPEEVSEIQMYLALSYLEDGTDVVRPLEVFQQMIRLDPSRVMETGYYPDFIVRYYENARETLFTGLRDDGPPTDESERIAELVDADFVFHGYAVPRSQQGVELVAYLYDVDDEELLDAERLALDEQQESEYHEGFGRLASRLSVCLLEIDDEPPPGVIAASAGTSPLSLELGTTYGSFLQFPGPIEEPFGNYGLALGASWSITREFQLIGRLQVTNSMRDYSGVLRENFTTIRAMLGGELGRGFGPVYLGVGTGLEMARIGTVHAITDRSCIPAPDELCPDGQGTEVFDDHDLHWGMRLQGRAGWMLSESFQLFSSVGIGYYFSPIEDRLMNFPISTEFGIRYRF